MTDPEPKYLGEWTQANPIKPTQDGDTCIMRGIGLHDHTWEVCIATLNPPRLDWAFYSRACTREEAETVARHLLEN